MDFVSAVGQNLGLVLFTAISAAIIVYLLYAMLNPTRF
jgi:F subunit of K+-transporting ATPase (Potass_KdpF)